MLLTSRRLLQSKALDIENDLRGTLRNFGLKLGLLGAVKFEDRVRELLADYPDVAAIIEPLLIARRVLREQLGVLHRQLLENVRRECSTIPVLCATGMPRTAVALAGTGSGSRGRPHGNRPRLRRLGPRRGHLGHELIRRSGDPCAPRCGPAGMSEGRGAWLEGRRSESRAVIE